MRTLRVSRLAIGAILTAAAIVATTAPTATAQTSASAARSTEPAPTLRWMSQQEYIALVGAERAAHPHFVPAPAGARVVASPLDPPQHWWDIDQTDIDPRGIRIPTRHDNADFGYEHYSGPHNLTSKKAISAAYSSRPFVDQGSHAEYLGYLVFGDELIAEIHTVAQLATSTDDGRYTTPDGQYIGTITAYYEGMNVCPDIVNSQG